MQIVYGKGKKSKHGFMPFGDVVPPAYVWKRMHDIRFYKRENTLKAVLRRIQKQNYEKGTTIYVPSWYVGYADLYVIV